MMHKSTFLEESRSRAEDLGFARPNFDIDILNKEFEDAHPKEILAWCIDNFKKGLVVTTSFNTSTIVHLLYRELNPGRAVQVIFLDTLHHFPETLDAVQESKEFYNLDLRVYRPYTASRRRDFAETYGDALWETDIERFHYLTKVEPLQRALNQMNVSAWITGRRRDQSDLRKKMNIFERDSQGRLKLNPLANWDRQDLWDYIEANKVLYNSLHNQGYTSIGDEPLTTPVAEGETERAGRWRGSKKCECGMHLW